mgnify:CR=1 FL=1
MNCPCGASYCPLKPCRRHIGRLLQRLLSARMLIEEVYSQCPEENPWVREAEKWLEKEEV